MTTEMREYFSHFDGMPHGMFDNEMFCFYPLAEVLPVPTVLLSNQHRKLDLAGIERSLPNVASYFVFADYSIQCNLYAVRLSAEPSVTSPVIWIGVGDRCSVIANS